MAETKHTHVRGEFLPSPFSQMRDLYQCASCPLGMNYRWWDGYEQNQRDAAHGLPDHDKRVASVVALAASKSLLHEEWMTVEEVIDAYHAWREEGKEP